MVSLGLVVCRHFQSVTQAKNKVLVTLARCTSFQLAKLAWWGRGLSKCTFLVVFLGNRTLQKASSESCADSASLRK